MSNILTIPASGAIYFSTSNAGSPIVPSSTTSVSLSYDGGGALAINSLSPSLPRLLVNGTNGRLLTVNDTLIGNTLVVNGSISSGNVVFATGGNSNLWNLGYTSVFGNSANWNSVYGTVLTLSSGWQSVYTTVLTTSGRWESVYISVNTLSSGWESTRTTVNANSGKWETAYTITQSISSLTPASISANYVPYVGAIADVNLGVRKLSAGAITSNAQYNVDSIVRFPNKYSAANSAVGGYIKARDATEANSLQFNFGNGGGAFSFMGLDYSSEVIIIPGFGGDYGGTIKLGYNSVITSDAANVIAQRNSTNPQILRVYNTFTDSSNYERGFFKWESNILKIGTEAGGTGQQRNVGFVGPNNTFFGLEGYQATYTNSLTYQNSAGLVLRTTDLTSSHAIQFITGNSTIGNIQLYSKTPIDGQASFHITFGSSYELGKFIKGDNRTGSVVFSDVNVDDTYNNGRLLVRNRWDGAPALVVAKRAAGTTGDLIDVTDETLTNNYFTIKSDGKVGIGTSTPNEKLTVVGNISASNIIYAGNAGNSVQWNQAYNIAQGLSSLTPAAISGTYVPYVGAIKGVDLGVQPLTANVITVGSGSAANPSYTFVNDSNTGIYSSAADTLDFVTGSFSRFTISNGAINVSLPLNVLQSSTHTGSSYFNSNVFISNGTAANPAIAFTSDTNTGIYGTGSDGINFTTGGTLRLGITNSNTTVSNGFIANSLATFNGNVDFESYVWFYGPVVINEDLTVAGVIYASGGDSIQWTNAYNTVKNTSGGYVPYIGATKGVDLGSQALSSNSVRTANGTNAVPAYSFITDTDTGLVHPGSNTLVIATGGASRVYVDSTNTVISNSLVANGTATFNNTADFYNTARFVGPVTETPIGISRVDVGVTSGSPRVLFEEAAGYVWQIDSSGGTFRWYTPGVVQMSLTPSQLSLPNASIFAGSHIVATTSLGAGINSPSITPTARLEIYGPSLAQAANNAELIGRYRRAQTGGVKWGNCFDILLGSYDNDISSHTRVDFNLAQGGSDVSDTNIMTLLANGKVGIGTTAPSEALQVVGNIIGNGNITSTGIVYANGGNSTQWNQAYTNSGNYVPYTGATQSVNLGANNLYATNIGIGTTSTAAQLDIQNSVGQGSSLTLQRWGWVNDINTWALRLDQYHSGSSLDYQFIQKAGAIDYDVLTFKLGKVGIGTKTPSEKLEVVGNIIGNGTITANGNMITTGSLNATGNVTSLQGIAAGSTNPYTYNSTTKLFLQGSPNPTTANQETLLRVSRAHNPGLRFASALEVSIGPYDDSSTGGSSSHSRVDFNLSNGAADTVDTTVMTLLGNKRVGIGTTAPTETLSVSGNMAASGNLSATNIKIGNGTSLLPSLAFASDTNTGIYSGGPDTLSFVTGGGTRFSVSNGNTNVVNTFNANGDANFNSTVIFNNIVNYAYGDFDFFGTAYFDGPAVFNYTATFNNTAEFTADTTFQTTTFNGLATFTGGAYFTGNTVFSNSTNEFYGAGIFYSSLNCSGQASFSNTVSFIDPANSSNSTVLVNDGIAGTLAMKKAGAGSANTAFRIYGLHNSSSDYIRATLFSGNNGIVYYTQLAAEATTNITPIVLTPAGGGALIVGPPPDNGSSGGNNRGANAADLQVYRSGNDQVASGTRASIGGGGSNKAGFTNNTISGGFSNTTTSLHTTIGGGTSNQATLTNSVVAGGGINIASAAGSVIAGGNTNIANGVASSIPGGQYGHTRGIIGYHAKPFCSVPLGSATNGSSQGSELVIGKQTTDATPSALISDNSGSTSTINQLALPINSAYIVEGKVVSTVSGGTEGKAWTFTAVITKGADAASTRLIGTPTINMIAQDAGAATWALAVVVDTVAGALQVNFTGQAGKTIRTVAHLDSCECTF